MDARSIAGRGAIGRVVRFSGRHRLSIQFRSGFFVVADDSKDTVAMGEDRTRSWPMRGHLRAAVRTQRENGQLAAAIEESLSHNTRGT